MCKYKYKTIENSLITHTKYTDIIYTMYNIMQVQHKTTYRYLGNP